MVEEGRIFLLVQTEGKSVDLPSVWYLKIFIH